MNAKKLLKAENDSPIGKSASETKVMEVERKDAGLAPKRIAYKQLSYMEAVKLHESRKTAWNQLEEDCMHEQERQTPSKKVLSQFLVRAFSVG